MTRQNVTDGPREILTKKCPTCAGDGIVFSEASAAVDMERKLRAHAAGSKAKAFKVEMNARVASVLIGPGAQRLVEIEERAKKRFFVEPREHVLLDFLNVAEEGTVEALAPESPVAEGATASVKLVELALHDSGAAVGKLDGLDVNVANAAGLVGRTVKVKVERVLPGLAYASLVERAKVGDEPLTAESLAEKPTRAPAKKKVAEGEGEGEGEVDETTSEAIEIEVDDDTAVLDESVEDESEAEADDEPVAAEIGEDGQPVTPKKRTRRGSRGGRRRRKPAGATAAAAADGDSDEAADAEPEEEGPVSLDEQYADAEAPVVERAPRAPRTSGPRIHVPDDSLGREDEDEPDDAPASAEGEARAEGDAPPRKRTRRGSRGGRRRRKPATAGATADAGVETAIAEAIVEPTTTDEA
jgi:ribonuclease G